jgi:hypothetical protein
LLGAVALAEGDGAVLHRVEINCDSERGAQLVITGIALADARAGGVDAVRDAKFAQTLGDVAGDGDEFGLGGYGDDEDFRGRDGEWEGEDLVGVTY